MTRVLVVEDNRDLAFGVASALETEGYEVAIADSGPEALRLAEAFGPDLVILDLMLPGFDGYRVLRSLRDAGILIPVLILTARSEEGEKLRGFRLGADDYVTKPFGAMELLARVAALVRRARVPLRPAMASSIGLLAPMQDAVAEPVVSSGSEPAVAPDVMIDERPEHPVARFSGVEVNLATRVVRRAGETVLLTPREYDLLVALINRKGAVMNRIELLREVWRYQPEVSTRTIDIHISELRRKLEPNPSEPRHILTVWKVGYRFEP
jgi:DNA-binding response OmpR family regulator